METCAPTKWVSTCARNIRSTSAGLLTGIGRRMSRLPWRGTMRKEIRIAGFGGQGVALAGMVLGKALTIYEDMEAVMTQAYGPEARGGASSANVVLSDQPIAYPFVQAADVLVALSQEAYSNF